MKLLRIEQQYNLLRHNLCKSNWKYKIKCENTHYWYQISAKRIKNRPPDSIFHTPVNTVRHTPPQPRLQFLLPDSPTSEFNFDFFRTTRTAHSSNQASWTCISSRQTDTQTDTLNKWQAQIYFFIRIQKATPCNTCEIKYSAPVTEGSYAA
jgi:hypothetical protein